MHTALYITSVWLHVIAACIWVGGTLFLVLVVLPVTRLPEFRGAAAALIHKTGTYFRNLGWICFGVLITTGLTNLSFQNVGFAQLFSRDLWETSFGHALAWKLTFVSCVLLLSSIHDFIVGPRATAAWRADPQAPGGKRLRRLATWMGRLNLLLSLTIVAFAVILVRGGF